MIIPIEEQFRSSIAFKFNLKKEGNWLKKKASWQVFCKTCILYWTQIKTILLERHLAILFKNYKTHLVILFLGCTLRQKPLKLKKNWMLRALSNSKIWKETKFPGRWLNNLWYINSIENYAPIKMINVKNLWQHERYVTNNIPGQQWNSRLYICSDGGKRAKCWDIMKKHKNYWNFVYNYCIFLGKWKQMNFYVSWKKIRPIACTLDSIFYVLG